MWKRPGPRSRGPIRAWLVAAKLTKAVRGWTFSVGARALHGLVGDPGLLLKSDGKRVIGPEEWMALAVPEG